MAIINSIISSGSGDVPFCLGKNPVKIFDQSYKVFANSWLDTTFPTSSTQILDGYSATDMGISINSTDYDYISFIDIFAQYFYDSIANVTGVIHPLWGVAHHITTSLNLGTEKTTTGSSSTGYKYSSNNFFPYNGSIDGALQVNFSIFENANTCGGSFPYQMHGVVDASNNFNIYSGTTTPTSNATTSNYFGFRTTATSAKRYNPPIYVRFPTALFNATAKSHIDLTKTYLIKNVEIYRIDKGSSIFSLTSTKYNQMFKDNYVEQTT